MIASLESVEPESSDRSRPDPEPGGRALIVAVEAGFDFHSAEYRSLFDRSCATAFQDPSWLAGIYRHLVPSRRAEPLVVTLRRPGDGSLAAVLPMVRRRSHGVTVIQFADLGVSDYASPVLDTQDWAALRVAPGLRASVLRALGRFDLIRIRNVREDTPGFADLIGRASTYVSGSAHSVPLAGPFGRWRAEAMDPSRIKEMDQKRRKLGRKGGLRFEALSDGGLVEPTFVTMREMRAPRFESRSNQDILTDPAAFAFYVDTARSGVVSGFAKTYVLWLGDQLLAATFGLWHRGRFLTLLSAFDVGAKKQSPGYLLFEDIIQDLLARGATEFDLTIGDESYKQHFGARPTTMSSFVRGGSAIGAVGAVLMAQPWTRGVARRLMAGRYEKSLGRNGR